VTDILARMRQIVGLTSDWGAHDLVLGDGEVALERVAGGGVKARIGDGSTPFSQCPYLGGALDLTMADARYVQESETFTTGGAPAANQWPRLGADGKLDSSLMTIPPVLHYKTTVDPTVGPPGGTATGDLFICANGGVVDPAWGAPAAGQTVAAGDWLVLNSNGQWQVVPMTVGIVSEAPADGHTYGRKDGAWADLANATAGFVQKAGDTMTGALGINWTPVAGAGSALFADGDLTVLGSTLFNGYYASGWFHLTTGFTGGVSFNIPGGALQFLASATSGAASAPADMREVGRFGPGGGFYVGSSGGDFGNVWKAVFRQDQASATSVAVINNTSQLNASANFHQICGTANGFVTHSLSDNAGAPFYTESFGSAVQEALWAFGGNERMRLDAAGNLGLGLPAIPGSTFKLQIAGDAALLSTVPTLAMNLTYQGGWKAYAAGYSGMITFNNAGGYLSLMVSATSAAANGASDVREVVRIDSGGNLNLYGPQIEVNNGLVIQHNGTTGFMNVLNGKGDFVLGAGPTWNAMTIQAGDGALRIGAAGPGAAGSLQVHNVGGSASTFWSDSGDFNACNFIEAAVVQGTIRVASNGTFYNTASDMRLKENIAEAGEAGPVIDALRVRQFDWKSTGEHMAFGMIAQELADVCPGAVNPLLAGDDGIKYLGTDYSTLVPLLIAELQALRRRVALLEMPT
jgi:hypothetical protein